MCGLGYMDRGGGRLKIRASEINRKVATPEGRYFWHFLIPVKFYRYFRRMVTLETGYGITQVVKASVTIS